MSGESEQPIGVGVDERRQPPDDGPRGRSGKRGAVIEASTVESHARDRDRPKAQDIALLAHRRCHVPDLLPRGRMRTGTPPLPLSRPASSAAMGQFQRQTRGRVRHPTRR